jgi:hypothetical protein
MQKPFAAIIGPELIWIVYYLAVLIIVRVTGSPVKSMDNFWVNTAFIIPLVLLPLTGLLYYVDGVPHKWMLPRLWIAGLLGTHFVLSRALLAHSEQGPGVGTAYMMGIGFALIVLVIMSVWALIKF